MENVTLIDEEIIVKNRSPNRAFDLILAWLGKRFLPVLFQKRPDTIHTIERQPTIPKEGYGIILFSPDILRRSSGTFIFQTEISKEIFFNFRPLENGNSTSINVRIDVPADRKEWIEKLGLLNHLELFEGILGELGVEPSDEMISRFYGVRKTKWMIKRIMWSFIGLISIVVMLLYGSIFLKVLRPYRIPLLIFTLVGYVVAYSRCKKWRERLIRISKINKKSD